MEEGMIAAGTEEIVQRVIRRELDRRKWWDKLKGEGKILAPTLARLVMEEFQRLKVDLRLPPGAAPEEEKAAAAVKTV